MGPIAAASSLFYSAKIGPPQFWITVFAAVLVAAVVFVVDAFRRL